MSHAGCTSPLELLTPATAIECVGVTKTFMQRTIPIQRLQDRLLGWGRREELITIRALKPVDLSVQTGEWVAVCGPNGSGKTTLMRIVSGLMRPDSGTVRVAGTMSTFFDLGVGFHPERSAYENVRLYGLLRGLSPAKIAALMERIIAFADVGAFADLPLKCYSTGMRLRIAFAAAAHIEADVYLFDEILAVGDESFRSKCLAYVHGLRQAGKSAILVGNSAGGLSELADRIVFLDNGRITHEKPGNGGTNTSKTPQRSDGGF